MSRHEGVSCDSCLKGNFRGRRFKCLICYDFDLCSSCFEAGFATTDHTMDHPMQCILARSDFDLYFGGEPGSIDQPQSFTCPLCGKFGYTEQTLQEHVSADHTVSSSEVVCPICATMPSGDPHQQTDDFASHLAIEHRFPRELLSFVDDQSGSRQVRRIPLGRGTGGSRPRRSNLQFSATGGLASLSPSSRDSMDPITELLSHLSGVRRLTSVQTNTSTSSQLQQQLQLQMERQQLLLQAQAARQQLDRQPRVQVPSGTTNQPATGEQVVTVSKPAPTPAKTSKFLLSRCTETGSSESELEQLEVDRSNRSLFIQEFILNTLAGNLSLNEQSQLEMPAEAAPSPENTVIQQEDPPNSSLTVPTVVSQPKLVDRKPSGNTCSSKVGLRNTSKREVPSSGTGTGSIQVPLGRGVPQLSATNRLACSGTGTIREVSPNLSLPPPSSNRAPLRPASPSSRRKLQRQVDSRNRPNQPPPPH